ncbi:MAG: trehalose-6-phosphate synthase, partial [Acidimicrobiia bacterium]
DWVIYRTVNSVYASEVSARAGVGAAVTVHGYELQLLPAMLRSLRPDLHVEFRLDIPFPGPRAFEKLPWRTEIIESLLAADVVRVQHPGDESAIRSALLSSGVSARDQPAISIAPTFLDMTAWERLASATATRLEAREVRRRLGAPTTVLLGLGEVDDACGTNMRLQAFEELLRSGRVRGEQVKMIEIVRPARRTSDFSRSQRHRIDATVGRINGDFGRLGSAVVHYQQRDLDPAQRCALYLVADALVATPMHHGLNAPALEFVACRLDGAGALVLSEFSPCVPMLSSATLVNPFDPEALASAVHQTIQMDVAEQGRRMRSLRRGLQFGITPSSIGEHRPARGSRPAGRGGTDHSVSPLCALSSLVP